MKAGTKIFSGLSVRDNALVIDDKHSPNLSNILINDKIGMLSSMKGIEKYNTSAFDSSITAMFQLKRTELFGDYPVLETLGGFNEPHGIYHDSATGYIYISNWRSRQIVRTSIDGSDWTTFDSGNGVSTPTFYPQGLFYDSSSQYIYWCGYGKIQRAKIGWAAGSQQSYGTYGEGGVGVFREFGDLYYDSATSYIYRTDVSSADRIIKTQWGGGGWTELGSSGNGINEFSYPTGIDYDPATEYIYVADRNNNRIVKTKIDGTGWTSLGGFNRPWGIHYDASSGYIYVTNWMGNNIIKTKIDGSNWQTYGSEGSGEGQFQNPRHLHYSSGHLYIGDTGNNRIVETDLLVTGDNINRKINKSIFCLSGSKLYLI